jgi:hypothetical protein
MISSGANTCDQSQFTAGTAWVKVYEKVFPGPQVYFFPLNPPVNQGYREKHNIT